MGESFCRPFPECLWSWSGLPIRSFLVRDSTTVPNSFVLTMFSKGVSKNFQIMLVSVS